MPKHNSNKANALFRKLFVLSFAFIASLLALLSRSETLSANSEIELLNRQWTFQANNGASENYQQIDPLALSNKTALRLEFDLHGTCIYGGDASAIIFDQPANRDWRFVSLLSYAKNCQDGRQMVEIPLSDFKGLETNQPVGTFHSRFWNHKDFLVEILSAKLIGENQDSTNPPVGMEGYSGEYWNLDSNESFRIPDRQADFTNNTAEVNYNWSGDSPSPRVNNDRFVARWTKKNVFKSGKYRFSLVSDDGVRLYINDKLLIDEWNDHPSQNDLADAFFQSEGEYNIRLEYYENTGMALASLSFERIEDINPAPSASPTPSPTKVPDQPPSQTYGKTWDIQSVSSMKESKDRICHMPDRQYIERWVDKAKELGVTHIAVETPYDSPACGDVIPYTNTWIEVIRSRGLKVWHRHMFLAFEGIYDTPKNANLDYLKYISDYIKNNRHMFREGDIFTPAPEPQNGGIGNFTHCSQGICMFRDIAHFNKWLRDAVDVSESALSEIGLGGKLKVGLYGFDGFIAWGSMNPDWNGILEDETIRKMGNIAIDHYPELVGDTMENALNELQARYPGVPIIISEWGSAGSNSVEDQVNKTMSAAKRQGVVGFNYWHMGMGGNEALINSDFTNRSQFDEVQSFFRGQR
ncbi:MAG: PA14 domain-containing protein [Patescibacteria group bacterium]|jgi:hypothetical protein